MKYQKFMFVNYIDKEDADRSGKILINPNLISIIWGGEKEGSQIEFINGTRISVEEDQDFFSELLE